VAGGEPLFESAVICDYLDETNLPPLHPQDPVQRARHRAWVEFASVLLNMVGAYYSAPDAALLQARRADLEARFAQLEEALGTAAPYFAGANFSIVDAAFAPVFRYFDTFERIGEANWFQAVPRVQAWRLALADRPSVRHAVPEGYPDRLLEFLRRRGSELSRRIEARRPRFLPSSSERPIRT